MKRLLVIAALMFIVGGIVGGSIVAAKGDAGSQKCDEGDLLIRPAPIHEVRVDVAESLPPQVFVHIRAGLNDACTTFHQLTTERDAKTINIQVTTKRPKDAVCAQVYDYFELNVPLGSDFTIGETYTITVNDKTTSFTV